MPKHRTNIYLTDELRRAVAARARRRGVSNSEVIRSLLEEALVRAPDLAEAQAALRRAAPTLHRTLDETLDDDPDLRVE